MEFTNPIKFINFGIFIFVVFLMALNFVSAANVGISPASVYFSDVLRGGYAERPVLVSVDTEEPILVEISTWGDAEDWINVSRNNFTVDGSGPQDFLVSVNPPEDIPNGEYRGFVRVKTSSLGSSIENHAVGVVRSALDLAVNIEIVDSEIVSCLASGFEVPSVEVGDDIIFKMKIENNGNIRLKPKISIDIWNSDQTEIIDRKDFSSQEILPTADDEFLVKVSSAGYDVSQYWADISVVDCFANRLLTFDVLEEGALKAEGILVRILTRENASVGETVPIEVGFKNTGEKTVKAQFKGEVTRNGQLVQILESPFSDVLIDDLEKFNFYFTPQEEGTYVVRGRVYYDGKKTFEKSASIKVSGGSFGNFPIVLIIIYATLIFLIIYLFNKIRKERKIYSRKLRRSRK